MFSTIKHLLPQSADLGATVNRAYRQFWEALAAAGQSTVDFIDLAWLDMFPEYTRELNAWDQAFGLLPLDLTTAERRERLAGLWTAQGGQDPKYIEDTLQAAGFDVYVHEWWEVPLASPAVCRNPYEAVGGYLYGADDPEMEAGDPEAEAGNGAEVTGGYWLVNKIYTSETDYDCLAGETHMEAGEPEAEAGENNGYVFSRVQYSTPQDPNAWPYIMYVGGAVWPNSAVVPESRLDEFENLLLKICPEHLWIGALIEYHYELIEDESGDTLIEDESGDTLIV